jgi:hypothetical protein
MGVGVTIFETNFKPGIGWIGHGRIFSSRGIIANRWVRS